MIDPYNGGWLAGFIDGEGSFTIQKISSVSPALRCRLTLWLRDDDYKTIEKLMGLTGLGNYERKNVQKYTHTQGSNQICWVVRTAKECKMLINILDEYPLQSKKAHDYEIWRSAVLLWENVKPGAKSNEHNQPLYDQMMELKEQMESGRQYDPPPEGALKPFGELKSPSQTLRGKVEALVTEPMSIDEVHKKLDEWSRHQVYMALFFLDQYGRLQKLTKGIYGPLNSSYEDYLRLVTIRQQEAKVREWAKYS